MSLALKPSHAAIKNYYASLNQDEACRACPEVITDVRAETTVSDCVGV